MYFGCSPQVRARKKLKRAERLIERAKYLDPSIISHDTIKVQDTLIISEIKHDTAFVDIGDTVIVENERLKVVYRRDTITNQVYLSGECKADTIIRTIQVPCEKLIVKEPFLKKWQLYLIIAISSILILLYFINKLR